jgi:DNA-binding MarR family transcriptional regulator
MSAGYANRQHVVNGAERVARSPAGDAFTSLVLEVAWLGGLFTAAGESLARVAGQSLARWVVLDAVADAPATVADVARRRRIARQAVQRVADLLVRDGLAVYQANPAHRRAQLLEPTQLGHEVLHGISVVQKAWADELGAEIGAEPLTRLAAEIAAIRGAVSARPLPGPAHRSYGGATLEV